MSLCTLEAVGVRPPTWEEKRVVSEAAQIAMQRARTDGEQALPLCYVMTMGPGQDGWQIRRCKTISAWCEEARAHRAAVSDSSNIVFSLDESLLAKCNGVALLVALICYDHPSAGTFYYDIGTAELMITTKDDAQRGGESCCVS